jgi:hypothetical protein
MSEEKTDWSNTFILIVWTIFWGNVFVMIFHPWVGLLRTYLWALPILNIAGIVCAGVLIIFLICAQWDNYKKWRIDREE